MNLVNAIHETMPEDNLITLDGGFHDILNEHEEYSRSISPNEFVTQTSSPFEEDNSRYLNIIDNTVSNIVSNLDANGRSTSNTLSGLEFASSGLSSGYDLQNDADRNPNPVFTIDGGITYQEVPTVLPTSSQIQPVLRGIFTYSLLQKTCLPILNDM